MKEEAVRKRRLEKLKRSTPIREAQMIAKREQEMKESRRPHPAKSIYNFLARHGLPAHYDTIAQVFWNELGTDLRDLPLYSPERQKLVARVYNHLVRHPELFQREDIPGVWWLRGKRQGRTYPELE